MTSQTVPNRRHLDGRAFVCVTDVNAAQNSVAVVVVGAVVGAVAVVGAAATGRGAGLCAPALLILFVASGELGLIFAGHQIFHLWIRFELLQQLRLAGYFKNSRRGPPASVRLHELRHDPLQEPVAGLGVCAAMGG
jgi:hypothetical protein